ncbi:MAG: sensor histidine kinase [Aulosira sp. ZfuVER01]|nr:HAMP domain-containing sensor histidine kinase [Aulosira sp. ZfuVER01]MDZ7998757.1 HAMP domain-containing sensor histidine kinase [Aulosira sp. DedVER01a]MDZ8053933.1 HAMP domain-containing sensor histidine kinase [Aulosira sp. ZfuCHP01]
MNLLHFYEKFNKFLQARIDCSSLQFRLTVGTIIIFTVILSSFSIWINWEIQQFLITSDEYTKLLAFRHNLASMSILAIATTIIFATAFIKQSLLPLRQIATYTAELKPHQLNFNQTPSELKALALNWQDLLLRLQQVKEQQQQLTKNLAHELRTPLSLVYGYLQRTLQRSHNLTNSQQEALEMAVSEAQRMTQILQNLIDLARARSSMMLWQPEFLVLNDLVADIVKITEKFEHRAIHLEVTPFPVRVKADRNQLMQVLSHLIGNAVRYSNVGELVTLRLAQADNWAVIQISDRGCGIPLDQQSLIFEPLYRVDPSRTRLTGGAGLGLSIVKDLVESIGGRVAVHSESGAGSNFILRLPALGEKYGSTHPFS